MDTLGEAEQAVQRKAAEFADAQAKLRAARAEAVEQRKKEFDEKKKVGARLSSPCRISAVLPHVLACCGGC